MIFVRTIEKPNFERRRRNPFGIVGRYRRGARFPWDRGVPRFRASIKGATYEKVSDF